MASESKDIVVLDISMDDPSKVELSKMYSFEGKTIDVIDLSNLDSLTARHMTQAEKMVSAAGVIPIVMENNLYYNLCLASIATALPIEFFNQLSPRDASRVKNAVMVFLAR